MLVACESWPVVLPDDYGIRPAGKPNQCFYCWQWVGEPHNKDCVCITKIMEYDIAANLPDGRTFLGKWRNDEPHFWGNDEMNWQRNGSAWCASNAKDIVWDDPLAELAIETYLETIGDMDGMACTCHVLSFKVSRLIDGRPHVVR